MILIIMNYHHHIIPADINLHELRTGELKYLESDAKKVLGAQWPQKLHNTEFWKNKKNPN